MGDTSKALRNSRVAFWLSLLSIAIAGFAAWQEKRQADVALDALTGELQRTVDAREEQQANEWQERELFSIIDASYDPKDPTEGATIGQIRTRFRDVCRNAKKDEPDDAAIDAALYRLLRQLAIYKTHDDKYATSRSEILSDFGRTNPKERAGVHILSILSGIDKGRYTVDKLQPVITEKFGLSPGEFMYVINSLIKEKYVYVAGGVLYSAAAPPDPGPQ